MAIAAAPAEAENKWPSEAEAPLPQLPTRDSRASGPGPWDSLRSLGAAACEGKDAGVPPLRVELVTRSLVFRIGRYPSGVELPQPRDSSSHISEVRRLR